MVVMRKGRLSKWQKIQNVIKNCKDIGEVYNVLDEQKFNLSSEEECKIAQDWQREQIILKAHGKGAFAEGISAC